MTSTDVLTLLRQVLSDTQTSGRWTDGTLLNFIDRGNKRLVRDVRFPDSRMTTPTVANQQEYQLPPIILPLRIYVAGQLAIPSDIDTLEGHQTGLYDQTTSTTGTAPLSGSGAASSAGPFEPQWVEQTPLSYPVSNGWQTPAPDSQPWFIGQRPRYYLRGGYLGLVPAPANTTPVTITVDCIRLPDTITASGQTLTVPDHFMDALVWAAASYAKFADDGQTSAASRDYAEQQYMARMRELRGWRKLYDEGDSPSGPKPLTYRARYSGYRKRTNSGC